MLKRLHALQEEHISTSSKDEGTPVLNQRPFAHLGQSTPPSSPSKTCEGEPPAKKKGTYN